MKSGTTGGTPEKTMTYARARLLVGISGVGTVVVLSAVALWLKLPAELLAPLPGADLAKLAGVLLLFVAMLAPFDLFGGYLLPRRFGRSRASFWRFLAGWARGVLVHAALLLGSAWILLESGRLAGVPGAAGAFVGLMLLLLAAQAGVARLLAPAARIRRGGRTTFVRSSDPGFTGGIVGLPGRERFVVPARWEELLGDSGVEAQLTRWSAVIESRGRWLGVAVALVWNLLGFLLAARLPGAGVSTVAGLVTLALGFNLWCFAGLLLLPSISRRGVFAADRLARERLDDTKLLERTLWELDALQDGEPERGAAVESVFHPIPALSRRLAKLSRETGPRLGAWHAARTALYLSIGGLGLLSRAVHCNSGRPDLWALLPCD